MPDYDSIREVGKNLRKTKDDSEAALRRAYPITPKIERTRDIFDQVQPFEMKFVTDRDNMRVTLDLYFNKPPPRCAIFKTLRCCQEFEVGPGAHLLQVDGPYVPGYTQVTLNGFDTLLFEETDPEDGLIFIVGTDAEIQFINICYMRSLNG